jgi:hypothetical protein
MTGLDEPFELFKGFNEIFIVVGLTILYLGFAGITGMTLFGTESGYILGVVYALIGMGGVIASGALLHAETPDGRPSIALAIMFGFLAGQFGISVSAMFDLKAPQTLTATAAIGGPVPFCLLRCGSGCPSPWRWSRCRSSPRSSGWRHWAGASPKRRGHLPADGGWALRHSDLRARPRRPGDRHALRHVRPASRDTARGVGLLAACDRGAGHREHVALTCSTRARRPRNCF